MKYSVLVALFAAVAAESPDCPESTTVFSYNERVPAAAGLIQVSACESVNVAGVQCVPNSQLFASGMNGDEDLGETIKMKGDTYKFQNLAQWSPLDVATAAADLPSCTGTNGPVGVNCQRDACTGTNGPMDGPASSGCIRAEPTAIPHYNEDATAGRPY